MFLFCFLNDFDKLDNPCYNSLCRNGGICSVISNSTNVSFTCTCSNYYAGQYCEISLNNIQMDNNCECMNNGSCINGKCICTSQYIGSMCQYGKLKIEINNIFHLFIE